MLVDSEESPKMFSTITFHLEALPSGISGVYYDDEQWLMFRTSRHGYLQRYTWFTSKTMWACSRVHGNPGYCDTQITQPSTKQQQKLSNESPSWPPKEVKPRLRFSTLKIRTSALGSDLSLGSFMVPGVCQGFKCLQSDSCSEDQMGSRTLLACLLAFVPCTSKGS